MANTRSQKENAFSARSSFCLIRRFKLRMTLSAINRGVRILPAGGSVTEEAFIVDPCVALVISSALTSFAVSDAQP